MKITEKQIEKITPLILERGRFIIENRLQDICIKVDTALHDGAKTVLESVQRPLLNNSPLEDFATQILWNDKDAYDNRLKIIGEIYEILEQMLYKTMKESFTFFEDTSS